MSKRQIHYFRKMFLILTNISMVKIFSDDLYRTLRVTIKYCSLAKFQQNYKHAAIYNSSFHQQINREAMLVQLFQCNVDAFLLII